MDSGVLKIFYVNLLLSGDAILLVAAICRALPTWTIKLTGVIVGIAIFCGLRILTGRIGVYFVALPYVPVVAAILLAWLALRAFLHPPQTLGRALGFLVLLGILLFLADPKSLLAMAAAAQSNISAFNMGIAISAPVLLAASLLFAMLVSRRAELAAVALLLLLCIADFTLRGAPGMDLLAACAFSLVAFVSGAPVVASAAIAVAGAIVGDVVIGDPIFGLGFDAEQNNSASWMAQAAGALAASIIAWSVRAYRMRSAVREPVVA